MRCSIRTTSILPPAARTRGEQDTIHSSPEAVPISMNPISTRQCGGRATGVPYGLMRYRDNRKNAAWEMPPPAGPRPSPSSATPAKTVALRSCSTKSPPPVSSLPLPCADLFSDIVESIANAVAIYKTIRSVSPYRGHRQEHLHIIQSTNLVGMPIYTKGKLVAEGGVETYYFLVSAKRAE